MNTEDKNLTDHDYDGIQEFDNPMPAWWLWIFLGTIIFGFHYWIHYEFGGGQDQRSELAEDLKTIEKLRSARPADTDSNEEIEKLLASGPAIDQGRVVYQAKCAVCHGPELQGLIGPNLVDNYWIHGTGEGKTIAGVIRTGVLDKGMPAWTGILKSDEIKFVTALILKEKGSTPKNPKAPQGAKIGE